MRWFCLFLGVVSWFSLVGPASSIGANWGNQASHPLPPDIVVRLLKDNGFQKVKLFDAEEGTLNALSKSGIEVMVGIPNEMLATLASSVKAAEKWVSKNVSSHISKNGVNIRLQFSPLPVIHLLWEMLRRFSPRVLLKLLATLPHLLMVWTIHLEGLIADGLHLKNLAYWRSQPAYKISEKPKKQLELMWMVRISGR